jgi:hypothetical protein
MDSGEVETARRRPRPWGWRVVATCYIEASAIAAMHDGTLFIPLHQALQARAGLDPRALTPRTAPFSERPAVLEFGPCWYEIAPDVLADKKRVLAAAQENQVGLDLGSLSCMLRRPWG